MDRNILAAIAALVLSAVLPTHARAQCAITGPTAVAAGQGFTLCAPYGYQYQWFGPMIEASTTARCVALPALERGAYVYVLVLREAGVEIGRCRQIVNVGGSTGGVQSCTISGPNVVTQGAVAELCASGTFGLHSFEWNGPGIQRSTESCIQVTRPGTYTLTTRNSLTGSRRTCTHVLAVTNPGDVGDPDAVVSDNCPRTLQFWMRQLDGRSNGTNVELGATTLRGIAARVDAHSSYFNWTNDVNGLSQALNPPRPMTQRKRLARQYAALLANVAAGEQSTVDGSTVIGLDLDTPVNATSAVTIGELMDQAETILVTGRGNFNRTANTLAQINAGRGIGTVYE